MGDPSASRAYRPAGMIHVANAVITISPKRIVYAEGSVNRGLRGSEPLHPRVDVGGSVVRRSGRQST